MKKKNSKTDQLNLLSEEPLASPSPSPDSEREWLTTVVTWPSDFVRFLGAFSRAGSFGKTYRGLYRHTLEDVLISDVSFKGFENAGMGSRTVFLTLNISEWPSAGAACSLSDILETGDLPQRYYLSATACAGILRRAAERGKQLPRLLMLALEEVAKTLSIRAGD